MHVRWDFGVGRRVVSFAALLNGRSFRLLALSGVLAMFADNNQAAAEEARFFRISGPAATSILELRPDGALVWTNALAGTNYTVQTASTLPGDTNWVDYVQLPATNYANTNWIVDFQSPSGMALIPAGSFTMGATTNMGHESYSGETPQHTVYVSAFYMDKYEVTKTLWDEVYNWATNHSYSFDYSNSGRGKASNHPAQSMTWYDAVKWCNARSEKEGLVPAYYRDVGLSVRYRSGQVAPYVNWNYGYRLATEAEWEKAGRGGSSGQRFPWGNTITHSQANYYSSSSDAYDLSSTRGYHPSFQAGGFPYTSPVDYFVPNGYGLYDMAGNVWEWCWDWYGSYSSASQTDPRGPASGSYRVLRGGGLGSHAFGCRTAVRDNYGRPVYRFDNIGFRGVRPAGQ